MTQFQHRKIIIFGDNKFQAACLVLKFWFTKSKFDVLPPGLPEWMNGIPFLKNFIRKDVFVLHEVIGDHKGIWFKLNELAAELTVQYYEESLTSQNKIEGYYNRVFKTNKFGVYIKDSLVYHCFKILVDLFMLQYANGAQVYLLDTPFNRFIVKKAKEKNDISYDFHWVKGCPNIFMFGFYFAFILKSFLTRGFIFNNKIKTFKVCKEAATGYKQRAIADDVIVDGKRFMDKDLLLVELNERDPRRVKFFEEANQKGYSTLSVPKLSINFCKDFPLFLFLYIWIPFFWFIKLAFSKDKELYYYLCLFHKDALPFSVLMSHCRLGCFLSSSDLKYNNQVIIFNFYGVEFVLAHWSDIVAYKSIYFAFNACDIYFIWGNIYKDFHALYREVDEFATVGCIYKKSFAEFVDRKEEILSMLPHPFDRSKKTVVFFDTSFDDYMEYTEKFYLDFIGLIIEFCYAHPELNVVFKPKNNAALVSQKFVHLNKKYVLLREELVRMDNLIYLDPLDWGFEKIMVVADVVVSMSMNSTSTVALACNKNALYYDTTGNQYHPIARDFSGVLVFDSKELLFNKIDEILGGRFNCRDVLKERYMRQFDAFDDNKAIDRFRQRIHELVSADEKII